MRVPPINGIQQNIATDGVLTQEKNNIYLSSHPTLQVITQDYLSENRNNNEKEVLQNRGRTKSEMSSFSCWLCNEQPNQKDPFVCICNCSGSNHIHANCLIQLLMNDAKNCKKLQPRFLQRKKKLQQECSICKFIYSAEISYSYKLICQLKYQNIWFLVISLIFLCFCVGMGVLVYFVFIKLQDFDGDDRIQQLFQSLLILMIVLCLIISASSFLTCGFFLLKSFLRQYQSKLIIISSIKDKQLNYVYDLEQDKFIYEYPGYNFEALQTAITISKVVPLQTEILCIRKQESDNQIGSIDLIRNDIENYQKRENKESFTIQNKQTINLENQSQSDM